MKMREMMWVLAITLAALVAGAAPAQAAAAAAAGPNDACLGCHADASLKSAAGKSVAVDTAAFGASVHGSLNLPCTGCHVGISADKFPHGAQKPVECATCHDKAAQAYSASIHGKARAQGNAVAATCSSCHGAHDIRRAADPASRTSHANLEATCGACHGNAAMIRDAKLPGGDVAGLYHDSIHGQAINRKTSQKEAAPTCTNCHGAHDMRPKSDPESRVARANIPDTCGGCHAGVKEVWAKSEHGKLRQSKVQQAPGCTDCHSAHSIAQHNKPEWQVAVIKSCGTCHAEKLDTYRDTFHGQVTALGDARMATCDSCHGAHSVLPASDPMSKVSAQNRLGTCQTCHANATANFADYDPHPNRHKREAGQLLFFTGKFMDLLLLGVFAFFGVHTLLWFYRSLMIMRERRGKRPPGSPGEKH